MAKGKSTWKYNKLLTARRNYYDNGGQATTPQTGFLGLDWSNPFKGANGAAAKSALVNAVGSAVGGIGGGLLSGGMTSTAGNVLSGLSGIAGAIPGTWGAVASAGLGVLGGLTNRMFGSKMNTENIAKVEANINNLNNFQSNASDFDTLSNNWANADVGMIFNNDFIGKDGWFSSKAKNKAADLRRQIEAGNAWVQNTLVNNAENIGTTQMQNLLGNYAAFGGELNTQGGDFTNGLLSINTGGSHSENPYEGVPMGVDPEGTPNLVEEGETIFNDYVFSRRLRVPKAIRKKYKLKGTKNITFAEISKKLAKESEERPNDPISIRGLEAIMADLANAQESVKANERNNSFALGGKVNKFDGNPWTPSKINPYGYEEDYYGLGDIPFWIQDGQYTDSYKNYIRNNYEVDAFRRHLKDQFDFYDNATPKQKASKRYKAIKKFIDANPDWYDNRETIDSWNLDGFIEQAKELALSKPGFMHPETIYKKYANENSSSPSQKEIVERHMLRNPDGLPTAMPESDIYYPGTINGYDWATKFAKQYTRANNGAYEETTDDNGNTVRTYYYDPVKQAEKEISKYYYNKGTADNPEYIEYTDEDAPVWMRNNKYYFTNSAKQDNTTSYFYDPKGEVKENRYYDWLRYAPALGFGIGTLTDALGITNKPNYSNADAVLEAARGAGTYQPVKFNPIGNYLTYRPFDRDYYINKMNAEAGAARRAITNTSGGNRATAMAGILAADNNYLNQIGSLARQAEEYNLAQRVQTEGFNRETNTANSQGFLQADMANQRALMNARELSLKGVMTAAQMREAERQATDANKSANISGLFQALGDIGYEQQNAKMLDNLIESGYVPGGERFGFRGAYGGKLKRKKKGLTF